MIRDLVQAGQPIRNILGADGDNRIAEFLYDPLTLSSSPIREYIWMNGRAVAVIEAGQVYLIRTDHIDRPLFATDTLGSVVWEASYEPFGGVHVTSGTPIALRFPGQWFQAESGLHQNWMRDYDPTTGRYIQADPLGLVDGASVYGYALQNPGRYIDPTGLWCIPCIGLMAGGGISTGASANLTGIAIGVGIVSMAPTPVGDGSTSGEAEESADEGEHCPDPCKGLRRQLEEHRKKLEDYMKNPAAADNKGILGVDPARDKAIIDGRIRNLTRQIRNFEKLLADCLRKYG